MVKEIQVDDETYSLLEQVRLKLEAKAGRRLSFDEVIKQMEGQGPGKGEGEEEDPMGIIWERLGEIQDTLLEIKDMLSARSAAPRGEEASTGEIVKTADELAQAEEQAQAEEEPMETTGELESPEEEVPESPPKTGRPRISIPTSPPRSRQAPSRTNYEEFPRGGQEDAFVSFIKNVGAYPLSRIRKPISQIRELENKQLVKVIGEGDDRVLVYKPYYDGIIASLPKTEQEVEQLSPAQKKILDEMHKATLVYKDQNGVWRLTTPVRRENDRLAAA